MYLYKKPWKAKKTPKPLKRGTLKKSLGRKGKERLEGMAKARAHYLCITSDPACQLCGNGFYDGTFDLHHKLTRARGGDESYPNLVAVHRICHQLIHASAFALDFTQESNASILNGDKI